MQACDASRFLKPFASPMHLAIDLDHIPTRAENGAVHVVVESPRGSRVKLKYDSTLRVFKLSRPLVTGLRYPYDWGFIPGTLAPDGDPLDAMIFCDFATYPGVVVECRPFAVIRLEQNRKTGQGRERNDRLIVIPAKMPRFESFRKPSDLPRRWREELDQFFLASIRFQKKDAKILGWSGPAEGERMIQLCARAAQKQAKESK